MSCSKIVRDLILFLEPVTRIHNYSEPLFYRLRNYWRILMRISRSAVLPIAAIALAVSLYGDDVLDCGQRSLAKAVTDNEGHKTIKFTGVCSGPILINTDGLTLIGVGAAIIDGGKQDAVTVAGVHAVSLSNFEVRNGLSGIIGTNGAHVSLTNVKSHDNALFGISLQTSSSGILAGVTVANNKLHGLDLETGSAATVTGAFTASSNQVFGVNVNGSSITFTQANGTFTGNALGMQVATSGNAFISDPATVLNFTSNLADGLTIVSGAHMVTFGGTINASLNGVNGVSVNSKAGFDLDAGSSLNTFTNGGGPFGPGNGLLVQEGSVVTVFNIPQFSGASGFSTIDAHGNTGSGVILRTGSTLTVSNQAKVLSAQNAEFGVIADNVNLTLVNSSLTGNGAKDIQLTFGARADLQAAFGSYSCDRTVLVRGSSIVCPH